MTLPVISILGTERCAGVLYHPKFNREPVHNPIRKGKHPKLRATGYRASSDNAIRFIAEVLYGAFDGLAPSVQLWPRKQP